jgi:type II secretory pathway component GspD/PulD (secretin)
MRFWLLIPILCLGAAGVADQPHGSASKKDRREAAQEFKLALEFQKAGKIDEALKAATQAAELVPSNPEYATAREALRQQVVSSHLERGERLANAGNLSGAVAQFREALAMDPENSYVQQRLHDVLPTNDPGRRLTLQLLASVDEIVLAPTSGPASIHVRGDTRSVYNQVGKIFGITFRFDDSLNSRQVRVDLDDADFYTAMLWIGKMTKNFFAPVSKQEAIVAGDTPELRRQFDRQSVRTFYVGNVNSPAELTDIVNVLRTVFEISVVASSPSQNTITVKAPRETVEAAASMIENVMDARPEILLDVQELEFDTNKTSTFGLNLPTSFTVFNIFAELYRVLGADAQPIIDQLRRTGTINPALIPVSALSSLQGSPLLSPFLFFGKGFGLTGFTVLPISGALSATSSSSKTVEHVTLRAMDGESATFRVGSRFPIAISSFSSFAISTQGLNPSNLTPQFQYQDIGLKLVAKPHYQSDDDVKLDLELEVVGLGPASVNNIPIFTNRSFKGNITVKNGEPSVIMGAITDQELRSTQGYPAIGQLHVLQPFLNSNNRQTDHNQILVVVTPHVVRKPFHDSGTSTFWTLSR